MVLKWSTVLYVVVVFGIFYAVGIVSGIFPPLHISGSLVLNKSMLLPFTQWFTQPFTQLPVWQVLLIALGLKWLL